MLSLPGMECKGWRRDVAAARANVYNNDVEVTMRILITSGGTREPIDDVRYVGNVATGSTGARLAAEAVRRFHTVYLLSGTGSAEPPAWALETGLLVRRTYGSTMDLMAAADEILDLGVDAIIASAAVADFSPVPESGKITSQLDELVIRMRPTPKVIDHMRRRAPEALRRCYMLRPAKTFRHERCRGELLRTNHFHIDLHGHLLRLDLHLHRTTGP